MSRSSSRDRRTLTARGVVGLGEALARPRYEVIPIKTADDEWMDDLPKETKVTVTCLRTRGIENALRLTRRLVERGFRVVPHIAARLVAGEAHVEAIVRRLEDLGVREVFVIGGDAERSDGPYSSAADLLFAMADVGHGFDEIGIGGYPEGHPIIDDDTLGRALLEKLPLATYVVTQMCFDPETILDWVTGIRRQGVRLPVMVGIPGVVEKKRLFWISRKIGVGNSARFLRKHTGLTLSLLSNVFKSGSYSPDELVEKLAPYVGDEDYNIAGFHIYTFNQVQSTERWRQRMLHPDEGKAT